MIAGPDGRMLGLADLDDPARFARVPGVPLVDHHGDRRAGDATPFTLHLVAEVSNARAAKGLIPSLVLGRTVFDPLWRRQRPYPPEAGYVARFRVGWWGGRPALLADFYYKAGDFARAARLARRATEWHESPVPGRNFVDCVRLYRGRPGWPPRVDVFDPEGPGDAVKPGDRVVRYWRADGPDPRAFAGRPVRARNATGNRSPSSSW